MKNTHALRLRIENDLLGSCRIDSKKTLATQHYYFPSLPITSDASQAEAPQSISQRFHASMPVHALGRPPFPYRTLHERDFNRRDISAGLPSTPGRCDARRVCAPAGTCGISYLRLILRSVDQPGTGRGHALDRTRPGLRRWPSAGFAGSAATGAAATARHRHEPR
ncbi:hypothetical protein D3C81_1351370 [compost metagenome]